MTTGTLKYWNGEEWVHIVPGSGVTQVFTGDDEPVPQNDFVLWIDPTAETEAKTAPGYETNPIGSILAWSRHELPDGYVLADGATYDGDEWPQGYEVAQEEVTAGNSLWTVNTTADTFTVPDLTDRFLLNAGATYANGARGGLAQHQLTTAQLPQHAHPITDPNHMHGTAKGPDPDWQFVYKYGTAMTGAAGGNSIGMDDRHSYTGTWPIGVNATNNVGSNEPHNNMPPYVAVAFIVKLEGLVISGRAIGVVGPRGAAGPVGATGPPGDPGHQISVQRKNGAVSAWQTAVANATMSDGAGGLMVIEITPQVDCWWDTRGKALTNAITAAYHDYYVTLRLQPADQDGVYRDIHMETQHSTVQQTIVRRLGRLFRLAAGTTYRADLMTELPAGSFRYHSGQEYCFIEGKAWPQ